MVNRFLAPLSVEYPVEERDVAFLLGKEMKEGEPIDVAVLQVCEFLEEDDRAAVAIPVQQGELALRLVLHRRSDQGHDGSDP